MRNSTIHDLTDCTEYRLALLARPPRFAHGLALLLSALLGTALCWAALTRANLVVTGTGRVRPVSAPVKVHSGARGEVFSASLGGRVIEVNAREGDEVRKGDVLLRLDAEHLDHEIARRKRAAGAGEEELAKAARLRELLAQQGEAALAKARAELAQAREEVRQARERQDADVRLARIDLESAEDDEARARRVARTGAVSGSELAKATAHTRETREKLDKARLPVDESRVEVLRQAAGLLEKDYAVKVAELDKARAARQGEVEAAKIELAGLEAERKQAVLAAPIDGVITSGDVKVGDLLEPGKPVFEIAAQAGFRFEALVPSEDVAHLRVGMPARVKLDALDYQKYGTVTGTVCFIAPDSGTAEGQRGAFYVVKIELDGDEVGRGDVRGRVRLGMAGQAEIVTEEESLLLLLVKKVRQTIRLG